MAPTRDLRDKKVGVMEIMVPAQGPPCHPGLAPTLPRCLPGTMLRVSLRVTPLFREVCP
ncbi:hypothetical protein GCM10010359_28900 [Streptomyces morookaense]|nr:hypothetical protein GCM10010359_28900 [Streptomyces morookaense]